jgi:hypothetical protein
MICSSLNRFFTSNLPPWLDSKPIRYSKAVGRRRNARKQNGPRGAVRFECVGSGGLLPIQAISLRRMQTETHPAQGLRPPN